jgi:micrococcal nuclease
MLFNVYKGVVYVNRNVKVIQFLATLLIAALVVGFIGYYIDSSTTNLGSTSYTSTVTVTVEKTFTSVSTTTQRPVGGVEIDLTAYVYRVVDGDTFDGSPCGRVRLADINTPERGEAGYSEAKEALTRLILNKKVYLDVDDLYVTDKYGRLVAVVYVEYNSTHLLNVNKWLLVNGYAKTADYPNEFNPSDWSLYVKAFP